MRDRNITCLLIETEFKKKMRFLKFAIFNYASCMNDEDTKLFFQKLISSQSHMNQKGHRSVVLVISSTLFSIALTIPALLKTIFNHFR